ncbi:queuine tRNA-ribosyltransferase [Microdochium trichocladiopsis]|uniref:Queuine tRNA-ribosyltransferase catalytic subunit 1 n=1 Tax=Microdochium trichocladiopsis TaxID=1682393 RepID=A0A9P8Y7I9_9PEZI|nr:queuine tRNA-ribosyltransferase [Microdochium trichocladiopsis]KAH7031318.1 queuine tRNA-ribosyltransferase [Microdochium trichocladiopsis]
MASTIASQSSAALTFDLVARCSTTRARASNLTLPHGPVQLPIFMPVATQASLKGLTPEQLEETGCRLCLNNTYHLGLKPGQDVLDAVGGAHKLQGWSHNILTDSGGFQMVSLLELANITEEGVRFLSPHDRSPMLLTPEHSIDLQNSIGSDIIMQLDDVLVTTSPDAVRMREAMLRSVRWLDRCIAAHKNPGRQNLFCIIQGGLDDEMRRECCAAMVARDTPGIAIGGLSGGEAKSDFCRVVATCTAMLPELKPRYVMGIGYPEDLVVSVALGADMFDCVWPTRTARFGNAITRHGVLNLKNAMYADDFGPIEDGCGCICCRRRSDTASTDPSISTPTTPSPTDATGGINVTRAFVHHNTAKETAAAHLLTIHNVWHQLNLMREVRAAIIEDRYPAYLHQWFSDYYGSKEKYPGWAVGALRGVGVDLLES